MTFDIFAFQSHCRRSVDKMCIVLTLIHHVATRFSSTNGANQCNVRFTRMAKKSNARCETPKKNCQESGSDASPAKNVWRLPKPLPPTTPPRQHQCVWWKGAAIAVVAILAI
jgi:hypothetical protein